MLYVGVALVVFVLVLVIRALNFNPKEVEKIDFIKPNFDYDKLVVNMADMIKCKTVSYLEEDKIDYNEFYRLQDLVKIKYPLLNEKAEFIKVEKTGLIFKLKGKDSSKANIVMAHYDVVPVCQELWSVDSFSALI